MHWLIFWIPAPTVRLPQYYKPNWPNGVNWASPRLLTFVDYPGEVAVINNGCQRPLRPAVIQRKVTNGFRSMWAAEGDCAVRTVADTGKLSGNSSFQTLLTTIS